MARNGQTTATLRRATTRRRPDQFTITIPSGPPGSSASVARKAGEFPPPKGVRAAWQEDAFSYVETIEPVGYVAHLTANTVAACDLKLGWIDETDAIQVGDEADNDSARRALRALKGPIGGLPEIMRRAGLLLTIAGEFYLLGSPVDVEDESAGVWWEALSPLEILPGRSRGERSKRNRAGVGTEDLDPDQNYLARVWRSDGRYSDRADCALRRCLDTCRELSMLSQMMEAIITTRLPMGLLLMPSTMRYRSPLQRMAGNTGNTDDEFVEEEPEFVDDLVAHLSAPIADMRSSASLVPLVVEGTAEDLNAIRIVDLSKDLDSYASVLRSEMVRRLAIGLDIPPEVLEGKGSVNHWGGANIDADFLFKHVMPVGKLIAAGLTTAYLQPILESEEGMDAEEAARWVLVFDPSPIAAAQDDSEKAMRLWEAGVISDRTLVEKQGWDPDTVMPDEEEKTRRLIEKLLFGHTPNVRLTDEALKLVGIDPKWVEWITGGTDTAGYATDAPPLDPNAPQPAAGPKQDGQIPGTPGNADEGPNGQVGDRNPVPATGNDAPAAGPSAASQEAIVDRIRTYADAAWLRALEVAGGRLVTSARNDRSNVYRGRFTSVRKRDACQAVTSADLMALGQTPRKLLDGAWIDLGEFVRTQMAAWLEQQGVPTRQAVAAAQLASEQVVCDVDRWTRDNLHTKVRPGVDLLHIPAGMISDHVTARRLVSAVR